MYRIRMKKNDGRGHELCFFSLAWFSQGKVIIRLEKRTNGTFETVGFINPDIIKDVDLLTKKTDFAEDEKDKYIDVSRYLKTKPATFAHDYISVNEDRIKFLESIITPINEEIEFFKEHISKQEAVICELGKTKLKFPTWKEYSAAIKA